jgi:hypothetical protein
MFHTLIIGSWKLLLFVWLPYLLPFLHLLIIMLAPNLKDTELYFDKLKNDKINSH